MATPRPNFDLEDYRYRCWAQLDQTLQTATAKVADLRTQLSAIAAVERYWAYPGREVLARMDYYIESQAIQLLAQLVRNIMTAFATQSYRHKVFDPFKSNLMMLDGPRFLEQNNLEQPGQVVAQKPYFEVLIVHPDPATYEGLYRQSLSAFITDRDEFLYDIYFVDNAEDALVAFLANPLIQCCVFVDGFARSASLPHSLAEETLRALPRDYVQHLVADMTVGLSTLMRDIRPMVHDVYVSEQALHEVPEQYRLHFDRIIYHVQPFQDMHQSIMKGVRDRFGTPFFNALQSYSRKPKGVFHALPLSRGKSVTNSHWIRDLLDFYGPSIFLAESSSTQGGMDSLLDPKGAIKQSHDKAAEAFGADATYFVTNGTSTSNKIVMQANLKPGDIALISADCHKSIPYSVMLTGATPIFLETYPLNKYDMYGAASLRRIKEILLDLKRVGKLDKVKQLTLTNTTFDGLIYNVDRFMMDLLAIKPDLIFHWDEAWFAFGHFHPIYHGRTAMTVVDRIRRRCADAAYRQFYARWKTDTFAPIADDPTACLDMPLYPDPDQVALRVYATQSTHKTLSSFRQASMIHVADVRFNEALFLEAYRLHTSTSPNYQIIASLDVGRRQMSLEGYDMIKRTLFLAHKLRYAIDSAPDLNGIFKVLADKDLIPKRFRQGQEEKAGTTVLSSWMRGFEDAEFVVDPTRVTVDISGTGMDGSSFRQLLMSQYDIQVNKTSHKTALFIVNIGSTEASITYLLSVFHEIADRIRFQRQHAAKMDLKTPETVVMLPQDRVFHEAFRPFDLDVTDVSNLREAYFLAYDEANIDYVPLDDATMKAVLNDRKLVSASFVTPYPPGFPVLVPGQLITHDILLYLRNLHIKEIHGYDAGKGLKVYKETILKEVGRDNGNT